MIIITFQTVPLHFEQALSIVPSNCFPIIGNLSGHLPLPHLPSQPWRDVPVFVFSFSLLLCVLQHNWVEIEYELLISAINGGLEFVLWGHRQTNLPSIWALPKLRFRLMITLLTLVILGWQSDGVMMSLVCGPLIIFHQIDFSQWISSPWEIDLNPILIYWSQL